VASNESEFKSARTEDEERREVEKIEEREEEEEEEIVIADRSSIATLSEAVMAYDMASM